MAPAIPKPLISDLVAQIGEVPSSHIRPVGDRPDLANVDNESGAGIPLIDLKMLNGPERRKVVEAIGRACESDGFFMVTNHGIPAAVVEGMLRVAREFFHLPESEWLKCYSDDPKKAIRLSTSFNVRTEKVSNWRDFLRLHCYPLESFVDQWPSNPPSFRQVVGTYATEARALALKLLEAISESLGLERSHNMYMVAATGRHALAQHMEVNYYDPPCPQPELTYGLPAGHKDPNAITLLLQDGVSGLQVQRGDGRWVGVNPVPNALAINIGDQMQVLSNNRYKSVPYRVIDVNSESERISVPTSFYCPSPDLMDDGHPLAYRGFFISRTATSVATTTDHEDSSNPYLVGIVGGTFALLVNMKDINSSWETKWTVLFVIFMMLSLGSAVFSICFAMSSANSRARKFSDPCACFGLIVACALFAVYIICQLWKL